MNFTQEFVANKLFQDQMMSFDRLSATNVDGKTIQTGAIPQVNGDVLIRLYLPNVKKVTLFASVSRNVSKEIELVHHSESPKGVVEGILPYDEKMTGMANVTVTADGENQLMRDLPIIWCGNRPMNGIEIPDPDGSYLLIHDVPHGQYTRNIFWSSTMNNWENCYVYTPAGYLKSAQEFPVLYLLHGGGDNELCWEYVGRVSHIMDNLIAAGKAEPFIIVMCNDMLRSGGVVSNLMDRAFEHMLIDDCIPFVENTYRVKTGKWNRAVAGLSMGSFMTSDIGFGNPDIFGNVANFTAGLTCGDLLDRYTYSRPYHTMLANGSEEFAKNYKIFFRSTTPQEDHLDYFLEDDRLFAEAGINELPCYHRVLYPPRTSKWNSWRMGLRDFAQLLFKE